jgi:hypothetical protein
MQLLDTYLKNVARLLPAADRDDIVRELSENLRSEIEEREAGKGGPLSEPELKAVLDAFGSPLEAAARYRQATGVLAFGRVLVGPVLFPFYARVLELVLAITAAVIVVVGLALHTSAGNIAQALLVHLSIQFGILTVIFSLVETSMVKRLTTVDLSYSVSYVTAPVSQLLSPRGGPPAARVSRLESLSEIVVLAILLGWLPALRDFARSAMSDAGLSPSAIWTHVYVGLACLWGAGIVCAVINLMRPDWTRFHTAARPALNLVFLGLVVDVLAAGRWVEPIARQGLNPATADARLSVARAVDQGFYYAFLATALVTVLSVLLGLRRFIGAHRAAR